MKFLRERGGIGIDIGGTKTLFALFDGKYEIVEEIKIKTRPDKGATTFTQALKSHIHSLMETARRKNLSVAAVGAGCAGTIDQQGGTLKESLNIPFLPGYPLRKNLSKFSGLNAVIGNDVQTGLYGELKLGAAVGAKNVIGVFVGTGVGGAVVIDGKLHLGSEGSAGNIGNYLLHPVGPAAGSNREGTLDDLVSRTAITASAAMLAAKQWAPHLLKNAGTDVTRIKSSSLARAIAAGDTQIEKLVRTRTRILGIALSNFVDFLNPDMVLLGGGLVDAMPTLVRKEVEEGIRSHSGSAGKGVLRVVTTILREHSVTAGAVRMALDTLGA